jgi:hypothetical protein
MPSSLGNNGLNTREIRPPLSQPNRVMAMAINRSRSASSAGFPAGVGTVAEVNTPANAYSLRLANR